MDGFTEIRLNDKTRWYGPTKALATYRTYVAAWLLQYCKTQADCDAVQHAIQAAIDGEAGR